MKLEQQIEQHLAKCGQVHLLSTPEKLTYLNDLSFMMADYAQQNKGRLYTTPKCGVCEKYHTKPTGARGWGSIL